MRVLHVERLAGLPAPRFAALCAHTARRPDATAVQTGKTAKRSTVERRRRCIDVACCSRVQTRERTVLAALHEAGARNRPHAHCALRCAALLCWRWAPPAVRSFPLCAPPLASAHLLAFLAGRCSAPPRKLFFSMHRFVLSSSRSALRASYAPCSSLTALGVSSSSAHPRLCRGPPHHQALQQVQQVHP